MTLFHGDADLAGRMLTGSWVGQAIAQHWRSRRFRIWAGLLALFAIGLTAVPLFGVLGFEFAFAMAIAASIAAADLGAAAVRVVRATPAPPLARAVRPARLVAELFARAAAVHLALLILPLAVVIANALRVKTCEWGFGFGVYLVMPGLSVVIATGLGVACAIATGTRRVWPWLLPYLVALGLVLHSVYRFYAAPPVFSYNPLAGYFPGNLYDTQIEIRWPFVWARLFQLTWLVGVLATCAWWLDVPSVSLARRRQPIDRRRRTAAAAIALAGAALALWSVSGRLGFSVDTDDIASALGGRHESEHFVILYPRGGDIERDIELIAEDHEFRLAQLERELGTELPGKITSLYFASAEQKFEWIGARRIYMAKPWRKEIYVHHESFPHQVVRHELAHVMAGEFGDPLFHVSVRPVYGLPLAFNVGLIEGIAVALDWPDHFTRELTPHQSVKAMRELDMMPPIEGVLSTGFFAFSAAQSYTVSGSFVRYLYDQHGGPDPLRVLYRTGGDFRQAYGRSLEELAAGWLAAVDRIELPPGAAEVVRERFRHRSIFRQICPHAVARKRARLASLESRGEIREAIRLARSVCADVPSEPSYQLTLADLLGRAGDTAQATAIYDQIAAETETVTSELRAQALISRVDQEVRAGRTAAAAALLARAAALPVDDDILRTVAAMRHVLAMTSPAGPWLRALFWGDDSATAVQRADVAIAAEPTNALAHYLRARNALGQTEPAESAAWFERALDLGLPHPLLRRECARLLAPLAYRSGNDALVERAAAILMEPVQPEVMRLYGADWLERLAFRRAREIAVNNR